MCNPQLNASGLLGNTELSVGAAIACFLAQEGADISYANHKGKSPLDLVADSAMLQLIKSFSEKHRYTSIETELKFTMPLDNITKYVVLINQRIDFEFHACTVLCKAANTRLHAHEL